MLSFEAMPASAGATGEEGNQVRKREAQLPVEEATLVLTRSMSSDEIVDLAGKIAAGKSEEREELAKRSFGEQVALERRALREETAAVIAERTGKLVNPDDIVFSQNDVTSEGGTPWLREAVSDLLDQHPAAKRFIGGLALTGILFSAAPKDAEAGWLDKVVKVAIGNAQDGASSGTRRAGDAVGDALGGVIKDTTRDFLNASGLTQEAKEFQQDMASRLRAAHADLDSIERESNWEIQNAKREGVVFERIVRLESRRRERIVEFGINRIGSIRERAESMRGRGLRIGDMNAGELQRLEQRVQWYQQADGQGSDSGGIGTARKLESEGTRELRKMHSDYTRERSRIDERFTIQRSRENVDQKDLQREYDQSLMELYASYGWQFADFAKVNAAKDPAASKTAFNLAESLEGALRKLRQKYGVDLADDPLRASGF